MLQLHLKSELRVSGHLLSNSWNVLRNGLEFGGFSLSLIQRIEIRRKGELNIKRSEPARSLSVVFITNAYSVRSCEESPTATSQYEKQEQNP